MSIGELMSNNTINYCIFCNRVHTLYMKRKYYNALKIIRRDDYPCQDCKKAFELNQLLVHHIDKNPSNNSDSNLITLCQYCHKARHGLLAGKREDVAEMRSMGLTLQEIGDVLGVTHQRVQQIDARNRKLT